MNFRSHRISYSPSVGRSVFRKLFGFGIINVPSRQNNLNFLERFFKTLSIVIMRKSKFRKIITSFILKLFFFLSNITLTGNEILLQKNLLLIGRFKSTDSIPTFPYLLSRYICFHSYVITYKVKDMIFL